MMSQRFGAVMVVLGLILGLHLYGLPVMANVTVFGFGSFAAGLLAGGAIAESVLSAYARFTLGQSLGFTSRLRWRFIGILIFCSTALWLKYSSCPMFLFDADNCRQLADLWFDSASASFVLGFFLSVVLFLINFPRYRVEVKLRRLIQEDNNIVNAAMKKLAELRNSTHQTGLDEEVAEMITSGNTKPCSDYRYLLWKRKHFTHLLALHFSDELRRDADSEVTETDHR